MTDGTTHGDDAEQVTERILGASLTLGRDDVLARAGVSLQDAQAFWRALGFPVDTSSGASFTEADLRALGLMTDLMKEHGVERELALGLTRAVARSSERLAAWHAQLLAEEIADATHSAARSAPQVGAETRAVPEPATVHTVAERVAELVEDLEPLLVYAWRRHLAASTARMVTDADPQSYGLIKQRSVGFADLVNFTSLVRKLSERDLGRLVGRFEALSADIITAHGGRLVKTMGDEVMFSTVAPAPAAAIALDLVDAMAEDPLLPSLRVGMARGPVITRLGDVFGTTVNRAARLTAVAAHDCVLVDAALARELAVQSGFQLRSLRRRVLQGVGPITPTLLHRASPKRTLTATEGDDDVLD